MLIRITGDAEVTFPNQEIVTAGSIIGKLDGAESDDVCSDYLDIELSELGITGGTIKLRFDPDKGRFHVSTEYTSPIELSPAQLTQLAEDTVGQWSDGIGEACFDELARQFGVTIDLAPSGQAKGLRVEQVNDGKQGKNPGTALAKAARDGDLNSVRKHLDSGADLEARLQRYTPLHLAIIYGQVETALELIACGANVNARDPQDNDALMLAAMSNSIADDDAAKVAKAILERGVSVHGPRGPDANPDCGDYTPLYMAENRKKMKLVTVLRAFGATR